MSPEMIKESKSRAASAEATTALFQIRNRRFDDDPFVIIFIDWLAFGHHHILMAVGVDLNGCKHVLGIENGRSTDSLVVQRLLQDLLDRGLDPGTGRLFVVGDTLLKNMATVLFGTSAVFQMCRKCKVDEITFPLSIQLAKNTRRTLKAAFHMPYAQGATTLGKLVEDLREDQPFVAANLEESIDDLMTLNSLQLPQRLTRELGGTSIIDNFGNQLSGRGDKISPDATQEEVLEEAAEGILTAEARLRRLSGYRDLWLIEATLSGCGEVATVEDDDFLGSLNQTTTKGTKGKKKKELRRHRRYAVDHVHGTLQFTTRAKVLDVSLTGVSLETRAPLSVGKNYHFQLRHNGKEIRLTGRAVWCFLKRTEKIGPGESVSIYQAGLEVVGMLTKAAQKLLQILEDGLEINLERRIFGRFNLDEPATINLKTTAHFQVKKISLSGMLIETSFVPEKESVLAMEIRLGDATCTTQGRIAYVELLTQKARASRTQVGVAFVNTTPENKKLLQDFMVGEFQSGP